MADARATIVVEARDEATEAIKTLTGAVNDLNATIREGKETTDKSKESNKENTVSWTDMAAQLYIVKNAVMAVVGVYNQLTAETIAVAAQQRDLARISGTSVEEAGKLIQAADDVTVSYGTVEAASRRMVMNGLNPSIDTIAKLADKYVSLKDPVERSQLLIENFGRGGLEMGKLLEKGGAGIKALGDNAVATGIVLSGDGVKAMREYEIATDNASDAILGMKMALAQELVPVVTDYINLILNNVSVQNQLQAALEQGIITEQEMGAVQGKLQFNLMSLSDATSYLHTATLQYVSTQTAAIDAMTNWVDESDRAVAVTTSLANGIKQQLAQSLADAKLKADDLRIAFGNLSLALSGPLKTEDDNFVAKQGELQSKIDETKSKIEMLLSQGYSPMGKTIREVNADLAKQQEDLEANAAKHEEATRRIVFGFMQQKLQADIASGAITGDVALGAEAALNQIGVSWGLLDQKTATAAASIDTALDKLAHGGSLEDFENALYRVGGVATDAYVAGNTKMIEMSDEMNIAIKQGAVAGMQSLNKETGTYFPESSLKAQAAADGLDKSFGVQIAPDGNLTLYRLSMQGAVGEAVAFANAVRNIPPWPYPPGRIPNPPGNTGGTGHAMGADFIVPSGYLNDSYIMRVQSGEHVTVTPQGQRDLPRPGAAIQPVETVINTTVMLDGAVILESMQRAARSRGLQLQAIA